MEIGARLFEARKAGGYDLADIAATLKIRAAHLRALEEGWWDELPSPAYATGFLRSYARYLGLDADEIIALYKRENGGCCAPSRLLFPQPIEESGIPKMPIVIASVFLALFGYCGWYFMSGSNYGAVETASVVPPRLAALASGEGYGLDIIDAPARTASAPGAPAQTADRLAEIKVDAPRRIAMVEAPDLARRQPVRADIREASRFPTPSLIRSAHASSSQEVLNSRITLRARADTWILVEDAKAQPVRQGVLRAGEQYRAPDEQGLTLTTSNFDGLDILVDGIAVSVGGRNAEERNSLNIQRDLPLDPDRLSASL